MKDHGNAMIITNILRYHGGSKENARKWQK